MQHIAKLDDVQDNAGQYIRLLSCLKLLWGEIDEMNGISLGTKEFLKVEMCVLPCVRCVREHHVPARCCLTP